MGVVTLYFSTWIRDEVGASRADAVYGVITAVSMGLIFIASPLLGAMTDRAPRRMPFLVISTLLCVGLTAVLGRGGFYVTALCFIPRSATRRIAGASAASASASATSARTSPSDWAWTRCSAPRTSRSCSR